MAYFVRGSVTPGEQGERGWNRAEPVPGGSFEEAGEGVEAGAESFLARIRPGETFPEPCFDEGMHREHEETGIGGLKGGQAPEAGFSPGGVRSGDGIRLHAPSVSCAGG